MGHYTDAVEKKLEEIYRLEIILGNTSALRSYSSEIHVDYESLRSLMTGTIVTLPFAAPFFWSKGIMNMMVDVAKSMPMTWVFDRDILPVGNGWFWFEEPVQVMTPDFGMQLVRAMSWIPVNSDGHVLLLDRIGGDVFPDSTGISLVTWLSDLDKSERNLLEHIPFGAQLSDPRPCLNSRGELGSDRRAMPDTFNRLFFAMLLFLEQKILVLRREVIPRSMRRRERKTHPVGDDISVVYMRERVLRGHVPQSGNQDWTCQWMVRGHWRQQWYSSSNTHRPKWIAPYRKGPADKPMRHAEKVFAVVR